MPDSSTAAGRALRAARAARLAADPTAAPHGRAATYKHWRCRCKPCTKAHSQDVLDRKQARAARLAADPKLAPHGSYSTYCNWGCRCKPCRRAASRTNHAAHETRSRGRR
jgi:hypothetical protein